MKNISIVLFLLLGNCFFLKAQDKTDLYNLQRVHEIRLEFPQQDWADVMDALRLNGDGLLEGKVSIDGQNYENIGVRYRDVRSFRVSNKRNALHIQLNANINNQNHQGYQTLNLSNTLRDPSMVREVLGYEIAGKYMIAPRASYTQVYVNEEYYGLFVNVEAVDEVFLKKNFGSSDHTFIKCTPDWRKKTPDGCKKNIFSSLEFETDLECFKSNYELKSEAGWNELIKLTETLNKYPDKIDQLLHVDKTLWMLAFNNVIVNLSSYTGQRSQNYYLYKDNLGRFVPIIWDLNLAFGSLKNTGKGSDLSIKALTKLDPLLHADNPYKPLISQLLKNTTYKKIYLAHMRTILYDNFMDDGYEKRVKQFQQLIYPAFSNDPNKTYTTGDLERSLNSTIGRRSKIPGIYAFMNKRARYLKKQKDIKIYPPEVVEINLTGRDKYTNVPVSDFEILVKTTNKAKQVKVFYRFNAGDDFQLALLEDDGKNNDGEAKDDLFGGTIASNGNNAIEYYVQTENALSVSFDPPRYMFELHQASLAELNN